MTTAQLASESGTTGATFLASQNPALVKRNVVAGFKKALLLPVTIVPKTMAYSLNAVTTGAFYAVSQIGAGIGLASHGGPGHATPRSASYSHSTGTPATPDDEAEEVQWTNGARTSVDGAAVLPPPAAKPGRPDRFARLQLLLSLDTALQLIQADRDCLKRVQTFAGYPGAYGQKVRDAIEEVFLILLQTLSEKHIVPGFKRCAAGAVLTSPSSSGARTGRRRR
jgi:recyclin-1